MVVLLLQDGLCTLVLSCPAIHLLLPTNSTPLPSKMNNTVALEMYTKTPIPPFGLQLPWLPPSDMTRSRRPIRSGYKLKKAHHIYCAFPSSRGLTFSGKYVMKNHNPNERRKKVSSDHAPVENCELCVGWCNASHVHPLPCWSVRGCLLAQVDDEHLCKPGSTITPSIVHLHCIAQCIRITSHLWGWFDYLLHYDGLSFDWCYYY